MRRILFPTGAKRRRAAVRAVIGNLFICIMGFILFRPFPAGALHFDRDTVSFTTLEELFSPGKELKVWSDTSIRILNVSFTYHDNGISWQYKANRSIPCTLSVGDTLTVQLYAVHIRNADDPAVDSFALATGPGQFNYLPLQVAAFPHNLVTTNTVSGPSLDTAGKCLRFTRDSVSCTLRHKVYYSFVWDDRFRSPWMDTRTAVHSWSVARQYALRTMVRCQENLFTDTLQTFSVTIAPVMLNVVPGAYKSGFFTREVGGRTFSMDFSQGVADTLQDSDIVFNSSDGYFFTASRGLISLGIYDSLPKLSTVSCSGVAPETSTVCRTYKQTFDSIVESLSIICPAVMPDTVMRMNVGQFCLIKTKENHYAILVKVGEYIGGIDREYYYWGYQSDGGSRLYPAVTSVLNNEAPHRKQSGPSGIKFIRQRNKVRLVLTYDRSAKEIAVYACDGSLVHRYSFIGMKTAAFETGDLPKGVYIVSVRTEKEKRRQLLHIY